jgi:hypothetical protein
VIVYVLVSDVGLNGYMVHGVYSESPPKRIVERAEDFARKTTGYHHTAVEQMEMDSPWGGGGAMPL